MALAHTARNDLPEGTQVRRQVLPAHLMGWGWQTFRGSVVGFDRPAQARVGDDAAPEHQIKTA